MAAPDKNNFTFIQSKEEVFWCMCKVEIKQNKKCPHFQALYLGYMDIKNRVLKKSPLWKAFHEHFCFSYLKVLCGRGGATATKISAG